MISTNISLYAIFVLLAIMSGLLFISQNLKKTDYREEERIGLLVYIALGFLFGAKYYSFLQNPQQYNGIFHFSKVGLSSYGALIGIIILLFLFSKQYKKPFQNLIMMILPALPLMYGIGKIGCFLVGCCYGIEYDGPFNITYHHSYSAPNGVSVFPIQLLESIVFLGIFLWMYLKKKPCNIKEIGQMIFVCAISKFLLNFLRMEDIEHFISLNQVLSIICIVIGFVLMIHKEKLVKKSK